ncbi:hypothetical protein ACWC0C_10500 [Streptomyces sp. NPDC001709]
MRWSAVAAAHGTRVTPGSRWYEVAGRDSEYVNASAYGLPGVWDEHPGERPTPPGVARDLIPLPARHTTAPERCWFGLWHGYGRRDFGRWPTFETPGRDEVLLTGAPADAASPVSLGGDTDLTSTSVGGSAEPVAVRRRRRAVASPAKIGSGIACRSSAG